MKKGNKKATLSINSVIYDSFRSFCDENAIMLSKKVEIWMKKEMEGNLAWSSSKPQKIQSGNKKVTLSVDISIYDNFRNYCDENAIMLSKKIEIWMKNEMQKEGWDIK